MTLGTQKHSLSRNPILCYRVASNQENGGHGRNLAGLQAEAKLLRWDQEHSQHGCRGSYGDACSGMLGSFMGELL